MQLNGTAIKNSSFIGFQWGSKRSWEELFFLFLV